MRANQSQERLHRLPGATFMTLYRNLAQPTGDPLILRVLSGLNIPQTDIQGLEAKTNGDVMRLSKDALLRLGQRYGVTFEQLLTVLRGMPDSRLLLNLLDSQTAGGGPATAIQQQQQQQQVAVFESWTPPDRNLLVDEGKTAVFRVVLHLAHLNGGNTEVTWHKGLHETGIICRGVELRLKNVAVTDEGQYRCCVRLTQLPPQSPQPCLFFTLKVRRAPSVSKPNQAQGEKQPQQLPPQLPSQDMSRTHKYALIVSCQKYKDPQISSLGCSATDDLEVLRKHMFNLGYRTVLMMDPNRSEILTTIERLQCMLEQCTLVETIAPHIFLLLDGHGTVSKSTSYFLPSDATQSEPDTYLRVEEDLLQPLARCLPPRERRGANEVLGNADTDEGLLVAVFDMCRTGSSDGSLVKHLCDKRIQRLYSTSYGQAATAYMMNGRDRGTFGVDALNKHLKRLTEEKYQEERLQPHNFLFEVSNLIQDMTSRLHNQSPDLHVTHSKASLSDGIFLSAKYAIHSANRIAPIPKLPPGNSSPGDSPPVHEAANLLHPAWRKFALLIGFGQYRSKHLRDLPFVRSELRHVEGALQLLGYQTVVCCDQLGGRAGLFEVVRQFCRIISASAAGGNPVQVALIVDGHGELSVSAATEAEAAQASSLLLVPGAVNGGQQQQQQKQQQQAESVDIEFDLARPLLEAAAGSSEAGRLMFGFYDTCRSHGAAAGDGAGPAATDSVRTLDSPHYCRVFTTSLRQAALAQSRSGSYGISALLACLREAACKDDPLEALEAARPIRLLPAVSERIARKTHGDRPGETQFPSCNLTSCRTSLADLEAYRICDPTERLELEKRVWELRSRLLSRPGN